MGSTCLTACAISACSLEPEQLPPDGEAVIVVDTNLPVPRIVSRLRIDVYAADGTWIASRDDIRPDPRDWPTSFSVATSDESVGRTVIVRLRAYPEGRTVPYRGIVYGTLADLTRGLAPGDGTPRLFVNGVDQTPSFEPDPLVTVDRVIRVRLTYGERGRVRVNLHGGCVAAMPRLLPWDDSQTCTDGSELLEPLTDTALEPDLNHDLQSEAGSWGHDPCPEGSESRICVPGGAFLFGDAFFRSSSLFGTDLPNDPQPERVFVLKRFAIDRNEVSVGMFRSALASGFLPPSMPGVYEQSGPPGVDPTRSCTFSTDPLDREDYPLSCVSWDTARAFCQHLGGDLPTEAQWEYASVAAARSKKTIYGWGDDSPTCSHAVYGRGFAYPECTDWGMGVQPLRLEDGVDAPADVNGLGLRNLMGSLAEHVRDTHVPLRHDCWTNASIIDPVCEIPPRPDCSDPTKLECFDDPGLVHTVRGGAWMFPSNQLRPVSRELVTSLRREPEAWVGFRCVYPVP